MKMNRNAGLDASAKRDREADSAAPALSTNKKQKFSLSQKDRLKKALQKSKTQSVVAPTSKSDSTPVGAPAKKEKRQEPSAASVVLPPASAARSSSNSGIKLTELQEKMQRKLAGSKFRWLNEILYTKNSSEAVQIFGKTPELFDIYHEGFRSQTEAWPTNPVDGFLDYLRKKPAGTAVADMGCGDAKIARTLKAQKKKITVHSFDLVKRCDEVVACDIANVPLKAKSVDVVIFCLSLMGINFMDFIREAHRILKPNGELKIAEVISRFPDVNSFVSALAEAGFKATKQDDSNKMFILFDFVKSSEGSAVPPSKAKMKSSEMDQKSTKDAGQKKSKLKATGDIIPDNAPLLKPCIYKRR